MFTANSSPSGEARRGVSNFSLQLFHKVVDALQFARNVDALGTMLYTTATTDAVTGLTQTRHRAVITDEEGTTSFAELLQVIVRHLFFVVNLHHIALVDTLVVMQQDGRDVEAIGTRHAVVAVVARNGGITDIEVCHLGLEPSLFLFRQGVEG